MKHKAISVVVAFLSSLSSMGQGFKWKLVRPFNYDERKVQPYKLPNSLLCNDGTFIETSKQWERKRKLELIELFSTYMFGKVPHMKDNSKWKILNTKESALCGKAIRRDVIVYPMSEHPEYQIEVQLYLPLSAKVRPVPVFLAIALLPNYTICNDMDLEIPDSIFIANGKKVKAYKRGTMSEFWQLEKILSRGYGLAVFNHQDISLDTQEAFLKSIPSLFYKMGQDYPNPDEWGSISLWAWQMSRVMDYIVTDKLVDNEKIIAIGHSRFGKTALWAAVQDCRFAMAISNNSGCGGAAISRRRYGETIEAINQRYPHWFCGNFKQFSNREEFMPFDQHELIALMAPRPVYIASAELDEWSDPKGEFIGGKEASTVYHLYGLKGLECDEIPEIESPYDSGYIGYHIRKGKHTMTAYDWDQYLKFADRHFRKKN